MLITAIFRVPQAGVRAFQEYEQAVLRLLANHGGELQRRLRAADGTIEVHVLRFPDQPAYEAFRRDPRRTARQPLLAASGAVAEVIAGLEDVEP